MNDIDFKDKSSFRIIGKEFIIVIVVVFSSLSFTLGFFVGKEAGAIRGGPILQVAESLPAPQDQVPQQVHSAISPNETPAQLSAQPQENKPIVRQESMLPAGTEAPEPPKGVRGPDKEVTQGAAAEKKTLPPDQDKVKGEGGYTVQLGALKNRREAEQIKAKYEKKGYKIRITVSRGAKNGKIYKVRTRVFKEKKDAEVLSLKLKKIEGLKTFVTPENG